MKTCETCIFWNSKTGQCRRYPPTVCIHLLPKPGVIGGKVSLEPIDMVNWPRTKKDDFCGEHNDKG